MTHNHLILKLVFESLSCTNKIKSTNRYQVVITENSRKKLSEDQSSFITYNCTERFGRSAKKSHFHRLDGEI